MNKLATLTDRQRDVVQLTAEGLSTKEVAARLGLSPKTVDCHLHNAKQKLGVKNKVQLARVCILELGK